jgi:peroxiredoxin
MNAHDPKTRRYVLALMASSLPLWAALLTPSAAVAADYPARPEDVHPLPIGVHVPAEIVVWTVEGRATTLHEVMNARPAVLVFFRGGWCPYCDLQLSELRQVEAQLKSIGYQIIAIGPDSPASMRARMVKDEIGYRLLSDNSLSLIKAFGIAFQVDAAKIARFRAYTGLDESSGELHRLLPVPAVYLVDAAGTVQFQYVNPDYRVRMPKELLLAAAQASMASAK